MAAGGRGEKVAGTCSCDLKATECPIWGSAELASDKSSIEWYKRLASRVSNLYPNATHWIDSSKSTHAIRPWLDLAHEGYISGILILYLARDVRGWAVSDESARIRKDRRPRPLFSAMQAWRKNQNVILRFLENNESALDYLIVSYESLIFQTEAQLARIVSFSGLKAGQNKSWEDGLSEAEVHDVFGNRIKDNLNARRRLTYDDRWQYRLSANLLAAALVSVWRLNKELREKGGV